ncbi:DUF6443 domain-containing protein [Pedobacter sp. HMWF019]|uniref:DUF6443 domain-containing protein n=1 Tax=Pedobacter sp. HMWF019 TaxID=2056856 RepID=UPI001304F0BB|nr:DUF6443 domain-containing protein [Pedobacter sp. HMWF019]
MNISKSILLIGTFGCILSESSAQNINRLSFQQTEIIKIENIKSDIETYSLNAEQKSTTIQYFDGLGRTVQSTVKQGSPLKKDVIGAVAYDQFGRQLYNYLPYVSGTSDGSYQSNAITTAQPAFYANGLTDKIADDSKPYLKNEYENSPVQRLLKIGAVGEGYQPGEHYSSVNYRTNTTADNVRIWKSDGTSNVVYGAGSLQITEYTDVNGNKSLAFKNKSGQLILKRQQADETVGGVSEAYFETYYIYDDAGNAKYILPPKVVSQMKTSGSWALNAAMLNDLVFSYVYDILGRVIEKKIPGKAVIYIVYDSLDRPILVQDGNTRKYNKWYYMKYDSEQRGISEGIYADAVYTNRVAMQNYINSLNFNVLYYEERQAGAIYGYSNQAFPTNGIEELSYYYYDDYDLNNDGARDYSYQLQSLTAEGIVSYQVRGLLTAAKRKILNTNTWLTTVSFYDKRGAVIQVVGNNQLNSALNDSKTLVKDFAGQVMQSKIIKKVASGTTTVLSSYAYDHMGRILSIDNAYNGAGPIRTATYEYNELGQLVKKKLHSNNPSLSLPSDVILNASNSVASGSTSHIQAQSTITLSDGFNAAAGSNFSASISSGGYLQNIDYRYNIRGQMTSINNSSLTIDDKNGDSNDVFGMEILYDQKDAVLNNVNYYNGLISAVKWMSKGPVTKERSYKFDYDKLYRLKNANFADRTEGNSGWSGTSGFDEKNITYDQNGNIMTLKRNALLSNVITEVDDLNYSYTGNRLDNISDGSGGNYAATGFRNLTGSVAAYGYDDNGNLITDPKKGLSIAYNLLNKTDKITITTSASRYINYTYDAAGVLLKKQLFDNNVAGKSTDYIDGFVYENGVLAYFSMPEGRVRNTGAELKPEYMIRDHQGNVRVSFEDQGGVAVVRQENSYYPFGMVMPGSNIATPTTPNNNLYNGGSEWQNDFSNLPDYYNTYYRNYDAALGRFISVDPKAEGDLDQTPYHYALNNPLSYNDPLGDKPYPMRSSSIFAGLESSYRGGNGGGGGYSVSSYLQQRYDKMMERQNSRGEWNEYLGQYMPTEKEVNDVIAKYGVTYSITPEIASAMAGRNMTYENGELGYYKNTGINFYNAQHEGVTDADGHYLGNSYHTYEFVALQGANQGGSLNSSIDSFNTGLGTFALGQGQLQFFYEATVVSETSATFSNISRISKLRALGRSAGVLDGLQAVGKVANYAALGVVAGKVLYNQEVKPSDILDGVIGGAAFIPGWGWGVAGLYFIGDLATKSITGESIGQHLNDYYGDKAIVSWK